MSAGTYAPNRCRSLEQFFSVFVRRLTDSSEEDEIFEISEEQQEQILAEVLRDNRKLEVS